MIFIDDLSFKEYLMKNNIDVCKEYFKRERVTSDSDIIEQIKIANEVHEILRNYNNDGSFRVNSTIGKKIESTKLKVKRLERDIKIRTNKEEKNEVDKIILSKGTSILNQAILAINQAFKSDYLNLIKRSMVRKELCLGKIDGSNLKKDQSIKLGTIKGITYNLVEEDIYNYLRKIRKQRQEIRIDNIINQYIKVSNLTVQSQKYIDSLLLIPSDSIKYWLKYIENKRKISLNEHFVNIKEAFDFESNDYGRS